MAGNKEGPGGQVGQGSNVEIRRWRVLSGTRHEVCGVSTEFGAGR